EIPRSSSTAPKDWAGSNRLGGEGSAKLRQPSSPSGREGRIRPDRLTLVEPCGPKTLQGFWSSPRGDELRQEATDLGREFESMAAEADRDEHPVGPETV